MNAKIEIKRIGKIIFLVGGLFLAPGPAARAQSIFQAGLLTTSVGGGGQLSVGRFYFQVDNGQVDFVAVVDFPGLVPLDFNSNFLIPGDSVGFSLGDGVPTEFSGSHTIADNNPFLPPAPWVPAGYDDDGNPFYIDAPMIRYANVYNGSFALPQGFLNGLLAGKGVVELGPGVSGSIMVAAVPEPGPAALMGVAVLALLGRRRMLRK